MFSMAFQKHKMDFQRFLLLMSVIVMFIAKVQVSPIDVVHQLTIKRQMAASQANATESEKKRA